MVVYQGYRLVSVRRFGRLGAGFVKYWWRDREDLVRTLRTYYLFGAFLAKSSVDLFFVCRFGSLCLFESMAVVAFFVKVGLRLCWLYVLHKCSTGQVLADGISKWPYMSVVQRLVPAVNSEANGWRRLWCCWRMTAQICCPKADASGRWRRNSFVQCPVPATGGEVNGWCGLWRCCFVVCWCVYLLVVQVVLLCVGYQRTSTAMFANLTRLSVRHLLPRWPKG